MTAPNGSTAQGEPYILTATGKFWFFNPDKDPEAFTVEAIASALSKICRFTGHTSRFYSVAAHSVMVCSIARDLSGGDEKVALRAILHDASEAFLQDVSSPLKAILGTVYADLESRASRAIYRSFGLDPDDEIANHVVKAADMIALAVEKRDLMPYDSNPWPCLEGVRIPDGLTAPVSEPEEDAVEFLNAFHAIVIP